MAGIVAKAVIVAMEVIATKAAMSYDLLYFIFRFYS